MTGRLNEVLFGVVGTQLANLALPTAITIFCAITLYAIFKGSRVRKLDLHIENDALPVPLRTLIDLISLRVVFALPKKIPLDWENTLSVGIRGKKFPLTVYAFGRKLTFVIDFDVYNQMRIEDLGKNLNQTDGNLTPYSRGGLGDIKRVRLPHEGDLEKAKALSNKSTD